MRTLFALIVFTTSALAQPLTDNEIEGAYLGCEGVRRFCATPSAACTQAKIDNCKIIESAWKKLQADKMAKGHAQSIDGVADRLRGKK
jgi:hypothetical protein